MRKLLAIALLISGTLFIVSCGDDEGTVAPSFDAPTVTIGATSSDVEFGATGQSVTFTVSVDADLTATWAASAGNANVTVTTASGDVSGTSVVVSFDAAAAGLTSITLTVTDSEGETASASTAFNVLPDGDAPITFNTNSNIPTNITLIVGADLAVSGVDVASEDGVSSVAVTVNGVANAALSTTYDGTNASETYGFSVNTGDLGVGTYEIVFTATDANNSTASFTHILTVDPVPTVVHTGIITENETWENDAIHILGNRVVVDADVTLTIEAGSIIKGEEGEGSLASALVVAIGGTLLADGTASEPIIFTSILDNIVPGETVGPNLSVTDNGLWGGLIVLGDATISADAEQQQIEGIPADETYGLYGGSDDDDNSGILNYVAVRHGGSLIGEGNEINGITLGGVGTGTDISWISVAANKDDGIEWFGGTVDVSNAIVYGADDDAIDIDQAYSGTIDNFVVIAIDDVTDHALEIDGPEGAINGMFTLQNGTVKGANQEIADFRSRAMGTVQDVYFYNFSADIAGGSGEGSIELDADGSDDPTDPEESLSDNPGVSDNYASDALVFAGNEINDGDELADIFQDKWSLAPAANGFDPSDLRTATDATTQAAANEADLIANNAAVTAPASAGATSLAGFLGWTLADEDGELTNLPVQPQ